MSGLAPGSEFYSLLFIFAVLGIEPWALGHAGQTAHGLWSRATAQSVFRKQLSPPAKGQASPSWLEPLAPTRESAVGLCSVPARPGQRPGARAGALCSREGGAFTLCTATPAGPLGQGQRRGFRVASSRAAQLRLLVPFSFGGPAWTPAGREPHRGRSLPARGSRVPARAWGGAVPTLRWAGGCAASASYSWGGRLPTAALTSLPPSFLLFFVSPLLFMFTFSLCFCKRMHFKRVSAQPASPVPSASPPRALDRFPRLALCVSHLPCKNSWLNLASLG